MKDGLTIFVFVGKYRFGHSLIDFNFLAANIRIKCLIRIISL